MFWESCHHSGFRIMGLGRLSYSIDRPIGFPLKIALLLAFFVALWAVVISLINVAAQGYETLTIITSDFNGTNRIWFDDFIPRSERSRHRNCTPAILKLDQCTK